MNDNKKMNPLVLVLIIFVALNVIGFALRLFFQFAGIALVILVGYLIWSWFSNRGGRGSADTRNPGDRRE